MKLQHLWRILTYINKTCPGLSLITKTQFYSQARFTEQLYYPKHVPLQICLHQLQWYISFTIPTHTYILYVKLGVSLQSITNIIEPCPGHDKNTCWAIMYLLFCVHITCLKHVFIVMKKKGCSKTWHFVYSWLCKSDTTNNIHACRLVIDNNTYVYMYIQLVFDKSYFVMWKLCKW